MLPITDRINQPPHNNENKFPPEVLARLKRLGEECAATLKKDLDMLDVKIPPMEKEVRDCIEIAEDIEKYLRATVGDCKITADGYSTPNELAEIAEQRISIDETLVKACEARSLTARAEFRMTHELLKLQTKSYFEKELQHIDAKTRDLLLQRIRVYDNMLHISWAYGINNKYCIGRNVCFIEDNIRSIQEDAQKIMSQVNTEEKEVWIERLVLCDKHLSMIKEKDWEFSKQQWLSHSSRKGFQATFII